MYWQSGSATGDVQDRVQVKMMLDRLPTSRDGGKKRLFLFARSETIYGGSNQIQRNQIAERALGLPREARPS